MCARGQEAIRYIFVVLSQHRMSCFGSWVFQVANSSDRAKQLCIDGGIIASLTWGLQELCPQVICYKYFILFIKNSVYNQTAFLALLMFVQLFEINQT